MRYRIGALVLALAVFLCPFSVFADGAPVTFGISVYDATTGEYLLQNRMLTGAQPLFYKDTLMLLESQELLNTEYDENDWPILVEADGKRAEMSVEAVFYLKVNGDILTLDEVGKAVEDGCIIEWIYSDQLHVSGETSALARTNHIWAEEYNVALNEAGRWLARREETDTQHYAALSIAGQPLSSSVVVSLPEQAERAIRKNDVNTYAEQLSCFQRADTARTRKWWNCA